MAKCQDCKQEMSTAKTCTYSKMKIYGMEFNRIRFGEENDGFERVKKCPDCNIEKHQIHHFGCDMEICPRCEEQLTSCYCDFVEPII